MFRHDPTLHCKKIIAPVVFIIIQSNFNEWRRSRLTAHQILMYVGTFEHRTRKSGGMFSFSHTGSLNAAFPVFVLILCAVFASHQVHGSLLDSNRFERELRRLANDALGLDELQVRYTNFPSLSTVLSDLLLIAFVSQTTSFLDTLISADRLVFR